MFNCPKCGMSSEPKEELVGGDIFGNGGAMRRVCAFCGWELPDGVGSPSKVRHDSPKRRHACPDALDELFGDDSGVDDGLVLSGDVESRFCRICANYLSGPFLSRCQAHHEDVEPMHVCDDYVARPK